MSKRILVIDDDPGVLDALYHILETSDYDVRTISRAEKIFDELTQFNPDLVLMDVMLSGMDGRNICKSIRAEAAYKDLPIILISANVSAYNIMFDDECAPNDFITKPFDMQDLLNRVEHQLVA